MRKAYRILAGIIAVEVVIQAMAIVFAIAGFFSWIDDGNSVDKATLESDDFASDGVVGFIVHGINGQMVIPLLAIILLIVSFFAKIPGGSKWAAFVLLAVVVQVLLGILAHDVYALGALHGLNAFVLFIVALMAARRAAVTEDREQLQPAM